MLYESKILEKEIKKLHSKRLPNEVAAEILKLGKPAYEYLFAIIDEPSLTEYQVINLLRVLYMMRYHGNIEVFVNKLLSFTQDERIKVRSTASRISICLLHMAETFDYLNITLSREKMIFLLQNALVMKLDPTSTEVVQDFLKVKI